MSVNRQPIYISNEAIKAGAAITIRESYGNIFLVFAARKGDKVGGKAIRAMKGNATVELDVDFRLERGLEHGAK